MRDYRQYSPRKARNNMGVVRIFDYIALIITIVCSVLLLVSYLATEVNPNDFWPIALLGLIAPMLYIADIVLLLYWMIRWKIYFFIPLAVLLVGIGNISLFFRPVFSKSYNETLSKSAINVMSYNVRGFINPKNDRGESCLNQVLEFATSYKPDIICFQEYQSTPKMSQQIIDSLLCDLPYKRINYKVKNQNGTGWGLAVFSRYPIINSYSIDFENSNNSALWADVVVHKDTIRIFDNHLQTTSISRADRDFITTPEFNQTDSKGKYRQVRSIVGKLRNNYKIRAKQADSIALKIAQSPYPAIVCGDFNDTPMSYTYNTIVGDLHDAFSEKGRGMTNTYRGLFNLFRIDYILYSPQFEAVKYETPQSDWSDHNPVIVSLLLHEDTKK